ncbi:hypothetical protein H704_00192 [Bartonella bacilliformis Peru38]|nr:hypothetical protein BbINS_01051 [Bartonella bacilliformis INS]EYS89329.1 hypothetical protein X472_00757 [Bartonella bacilliformis San Pedro600-02]KEG21470.1 hypothetical protein H704_00195 [Bartonella bacilliformis Peru38]KEG21512.1 hypothetical protein H704_00192 [Bartonella bacilliformis Peru38]
MLFETIAFTVLWIIGGMAFAVKMAEWVNGTPASS